MQRLAVIVGLASALALGGLAATACGTDYTTDTSDAGVDGATTIGAPLAEAAPPKAANSTTCAAAADCVSGFCVEGVCCDAACSGTCESCKVLGAVGICSAIPDGTDPDNECPTTPLAEAGGPDAGTALDAGTEPDAGAPDASRAVATPVVFTFPDGGLPATSANQCAGHCDGKRACAFAGSETTCGTSFCGDPAEQGVATCDSAGHCLYGVQECSAYACPNGSPGCKTSCASNTDCLATHYCDGPSATCRPKLANGTNCTNLTQCQSGVCDTAASVCCNADCSSTPGGTCAKPGSIGACTCSACAGAGGCTIFYADRDHDGYGDINGTVANGGAAYGCAAASDGAPPAGFVADHTDCFDSTVAVAAAVHPGQTAFFTTGYTNGTSGMTPSFDYDCSGATEKQFAEGGCNFANFHPFAIQATAGYCTFDATCTSANQQAAHATSGCSLRTDPGFNVVTACGTSATSYACGTCSAAGGAAPETPTGTKTQACH